ncbi:MAG: helix-turn-helix domain-containing protein [Bacteriovorax sp.]
MQTIKSPAVIAKKLKAEFDRRGENQDSIAINTGIDQSQISRILNGKFKKAQGRNVEKICKYANISLKNLEMPPDPSKNKVLMTAIEQIWDGSDKHAEAIAEVLRALKKIQSF